MRRTASEMLNDLEIRIARLERQARPIDHIQEGYDEMSSHPITKTPRGVLQYLEDTGFNKDMHRMSGTIESIQVSDVPRGLRLDITYLTDQELKMRNQGYAPSLYFAEHKETMIVDFDGRVKREKHKSHPISQRELQFRIDTMPRSEAKRVTII